MLTDRYVSILCMSCDFMHVTCTVALNLANFIDSDRLVSMYIIYFVLH